MFLMVSCKPVVPPAPLNIETIAVLLFDNESNDLNAGEILRDLTLEGLAGSPYRIMDKTTVDEFLKKAGIIDGGQLPVVDPRKLGKALGVQALLYGYVENFNFLNVGYYKEKKVTLNLRLVDVTTGDTLWENTGTGVNRNFTLDEAKARQELAVGVADKFIHQLLKTPLEEEARLATLKALQTLPGFSPVRWRVKQKTIIFQQKK